MKSVSLHQFCAIIFVLLIGNKLLVLPSLLYQVGGNDAILFVSLVLMIDFICIMLFVYANNKSRGNSFFERSEQVFGQIISKILAVAFIAYFLFKSYLTLKETENFLSTTIYTDLNGVFLIIPIILVVLYAVAKGIKNIGRVAEVFSIVVFVGVVFSLVIAIPNINLEGILPLGVATPSQYGSMFLEAAMWFGNYFVLYFLIGRVETDKKSYKPICITVLVASVLILALFWCFYSIFETSSVIYHFAISDITSFAPALSSLAKIDWFTVLFYGFAMVLQLILHFYIVVRLAEHFVERKFGFRFYFVFAVILILAYLLVPFGFNKVLEFCSTILAIPATSLNFFTLIAIIIMYVFSKKSFSVVMEREDLRKMNELNKNAPQKNRKNLMQKMFKSSADRNINNQAQKNFKKPMLKGEKINFDVGGKTNGKTLEKE